MQVADIQIFSDARSESFRMRLGGNSDLFWLVARFPPLQSRVFVYTSGFIARTFLMRRINITLRLLLETFEGAFQFVRRAEKEWTRYPVDHHAVRNFFADERVMRAYAVGPINFWKSWANAGITPVFCAKARHSQRWRAAWRESSRRDPQYLSDNWTKIGPSSFRCAWYFPKERERENEKRETKMRWKNKYPRQ